MITFGLGLALRNRNGGAALPALQAIARDWWAKRRRRGEDANEAPKDEVYEGASGRVWEYIASEINAEQTGIWNTEVLALETKRDEAEVQVTLGMRITPAVNAIRPLEYRVTSPQLLRDMAGPFEVSVAGELCDAVPWIVDTRAKVELLVESLGDPARVLPMVVVSETMEGDLILPQVDEKLAYYLFGVARVVRVTAHQAMQLTNRLGKEMSVFHGGVRMYWPQWAREDWVRRHLLLTRRWILESSGGDTVAAERRLLGRLMRECARATVGSFEPLDAMKKVITESRLSRLRAGGVDYEAECLRLMEELERKEETIRLLEIKLEERRPAAEAPPAEREPPEGQEWDYSVPQALAAADVEFGDYLRIPDGLCVEGSLTGGTIYYFLKSLSELCQRLRRGGIGGNLGDVLKGILAKNGIAQGKFKVGDTNVFAIVPDGTQKECRYRYHLRSGSPAETESVYWTDYGEKAADRVLVIAHVGRHAG